MKFFIFLLFIFSIILNTVLARQNFESPAVHSGKTQNKNTGIYSKHWFGRLPLPGDRKNPLLIHDIFIISFDLKKKFPLWIAYHLSPAIVWGDLKAERKYILDPFLSPTQSLSLKDYKGASNCDGKKAGYDKGHLAPLGSFKASAHIYQAQYLSNIVPQMRKLNQGPWRVLEEQVRDFVKKGNELRILTGPLFGKEGKDKIPPCWKAAQGKLEEIPVSYWKIVAFKYKFKVQTCAFIMPQNVKNQRDHPKKYMVKLNQIEKTTGLSLLAETKKSIQQSCRFLF